MKAKCPNCGTLMRVRGTAEKRKLVCTKCGKLIPIRDPCFLELIEEGEGVAASADSGGSSPTATVTDANCPSCRIQFELPDLKARDAPRCPECGATLIVNSRMVFKPAGELLDVFKRHMNEPIGINYRTPDKIESAVLVGISTHHFSVLSKEKLLYHFPFRVVLSATEAQRGVATAGGVFSTKYYRLIVQVLHMVIYKGAVGVGISL